MLSAKLISHPFGIPLGAPYRLVARAVLPGAELLTSGNGVRIFFDPGRNLGRPAVSYP